MQSVVSLELLTVLVVGPLACWVCYDIAKKNSRVNIVMIMIATAEIYGGTYHFLPFLFCLFFLSLVITVCPKLTFGGLKRLDDLLPRVARGQRQPRHQQLDVPVALLGLLQWLMGCHPCVCHLRCVWGDYGCLQGPGCCGEGQEVSMMRGFNGNGWLRDLGRLMSGSNSQVSKRTYPKLH